MTSQSEFAHPPPAQGTLFQIQGFRSLLEFSLLLTPGINVLVGPNGSGKTNFIEFLDFLDAVIRQNATTAISNTGGVAKVFCQENAKKSIARVNARVSGLADLADASIRQEHQLHLLRYDYEIEVTFNKSQSTIYISKESIRLFKLHERGETVAGSYMGNISVSRASASDETSPRWTVSARLQSENKRNPLQVPPRYASSRQKLPVLSRLESTLLAPDESIFSARSLFPALEAIRFAITRGRSFNILPNKVREPDDLTKPPGIMRDGSGLSSTLNFLQRIKKNPNALQPVRLRAARPNSFDVIVEWSRLIFPHLRDLVIAQDPLTGKYAGSLLIGKDKPLKVPFQTASDGTLKWLSLITLVVGSGGVYSIEEPENFLHPKMQQFLVQLFRDSLETARSETYFILSTHSETLINQCKADELVVFRFDDCGTTCHRVSNPDQIREEINRTGFGLGYYYANNTIS